MEDSKQLLLKRPINVKVIVTPRWKEEIQDQLQKQINQLDSQLQQLDVQGQRAISDIQKQSVQPIPDNVKKQIEGIQSQVNQKKSQLLEQKNKSLQQLQQSQTLELEQEIYQGQMESFFRLEKGDNLVKKLQVEIVVRDGVVEEIRGEY